MSRYFAFLERILCAEVGAFTANDLYGLSVAQHDKNPALLQQAMVYQVQNKSVK